MQNFVESFSLSREIGEVKTVVLSRRVINVERAAQEKKTKAEDLGIGAEEIGGVPVTGEADKEPQLLEDPKAGANGQNLERIFPNLIEKSDFKVIAAGTAVNVVTGRENTKIV